jgi:hypothetical protein
MKRLNETNEPYFPFFICCFFGIGFFLFYKEVLMKFGPYSQKITVLISFLAIYLAWKTIQFILKLMLK